jgi:hypothetical protein
MFSYAIQGTLPDSDLLSASVENRGIVVEL